MKSVGFVGNDVVDLDEPRKRGRSADERFVGRVYDEFEQEAIRGVSDPDLELWCRWAAKETAFKVVSKVLGEPPPFVHRRFRVEWRDDAPPLGLGGDPPIRRGRVLYATGAGERAGDAAAAERLATPVVVHRTEEGALHAVGCTAAAGSDGADLSLTACVERLDGADERWRGALEELTARLTSREADAVYSRASAAVRLGARAHLARRLGVDEGRLEIVCAPGRTGQRPPRVLVDGAPAAADVSLSHDGRWIAWAVCVPRGRPLSP